MPNVQPPLKGEFRSFEGIRCDPHPRQNLFAERELFSRRWNHPSIRRLRAEMDRVEAKTRPFRYRRSTLFGFCLVALLFKLDLHSAHRRVQSDAALRHMLGLPSITPETERRLRRVRLRKEDLSETGFPTRQLVSEFVDNWLGEHDHLMDLLRHEAYDVVPGQSILTGGVQTSRLAIDGTKLQSPYKGKRGYLYDPGSRMMGRDGERGDNQRWKMTAMLLDVPFVVGSVIATPTSEITLVKEKLIPQLKERSDRLRAEALARCGKRIQGFHRAAIAGDRAFGKDPLYEVLYDHDFYGVFTPPSFPDRVVEGKRLCRYTRGSQQVLVELEACSDGTHYCECQLRHDEKDRIIMQQEAGQFGKDGYVKVFCTNITCQHREQRMYVPFREPDTIRANGLREAGPIDYTRVNPIWRGDNRSRAINFLGCQAIEHYHQQRYEMFWLGSKDRRSGRRFVGNQANHFWHTLGDLCWNITIAEHFAHVEPEIVDPTRVYVKATGNHHAVLAYKAARNERAEEARIARGKRKRFKLEPADPPTKTPARKRAKVLAAT